MSLLPRGTRSVRRRIETRPPPGYERTSSGESGIAYRRVEPEDACWVVVRPQEDAMEVLLRLEFRARAD